jgi:hypothetical protein
MVGPVRVLKALQPLALPVRPAELGLVRATAQT